MVLQAATASQPYRTGIGTKARAERVIRPVRARTPTLSLTCQTQRNYSFAMAETTRSSPIDLELKRLDKRIEELLDTMQQLKEENRALRAAPGTALHREDLAAAA